MTDQLDSTFFLDKFIFGFSDEELLEYMHSPRHSLQIMAILNEPESFIPFWDFKLWDAYFDARYNIFRQFEGPEFADSYASIILSWSSQLKDIFASREWFPARSLPDLKTRDTIIATNLFDILYKNSSHFLWDRQTLEDAMDQFKLVVSLPSILSSMHAAFALRGSWYMADLVSNKFNDNFRGKSIFNESPIFHLDRYAILAQRVILVCMRRDECNLGMTLEVQKMKELMILLKKIEIRNAQNLAQKPYSPSVSPPNQRPTPSSPRGLSPHLTTKQQEIDNLALTPSPSKAPLSSHKTIKTNLLPISSSTPQIETSSAAAQPDVESIEALVRIYLLTQECLCIQQNIDLAEDEKRRKGDQSLCMNHKNFILTLCSWAIYKKVPSVIRTIASSSQDLSPQLMQVIHETLASTFKNYKQLMSVKAQYDAQIGSAASTLMSSSSALSMKSTFSSKFKSTPVSQPTDKYAGRFEIPEDAYVSLLQESVLNDSRACWTVLEVNYGMRRFTSLSVVRAPPHLISKRRASRYEDKKGDDKEEDTSSDRKASSSLNLDSRRKCMELEKKEDEIVEDVNDDAWMGRNVELVKRQFRDLANRGGKFFCSSIFDLEKFIFEYGCLLDRFENDAVVAVPIFDHHELFARGIPPSLFHFVMHDRNKLEYFQYSPSMLRRVFNVKIKGVPPTLFRKGLLATPEAEVTEERGSGMIKSSLRNNKGISSSPLTLPASNPKTASDDITSASSSVSFSFFLSQLTAQKSLTVMPSISQGEHEAIGCQSVEDVTFDLFGRNRTAMRGFNTQLIEGRRSDRTLFVGGELLGDSSGGNMILMDPHPKKRFLLVERLEFNEESVGRFRAYSRFDRGRLVEGEDELGGSDEKSKLLAGGFMLADAKPSVVGQYRNDFLL
eukprot:GDKJ01042004.1.p1 GENE.GDKJ01042004.1~~GDKJ01042004.1.p1  ORF type:complete len:896 (+),score=168.02 GDKJ01042004.1:68-2755(+)